ncbi:trypco2 family protein [Pseudomonas sp.]|uniref:trypco2 family protein n=1 Tax=Pseudomonas sp. TaxID=306 RepID=UPI004053D80D
MKGKISIKEFIKSVKEEIRESIDDENPLFELTNVELEVAFQLEANAGAGFKLVVFDASAQTKATQTHKVTISLTPLSEKSKISKDTNIHKAIVERGGARKPGAFSVSKPTVQSKKPSMTMYKETGKIFAKKSTAKKQ